MKKLLGFVLIAGVIIYSLACHNSLHSLKLTAPADTTTIITIGNYQAYYHLTGTYNASKKYNVWVNLPGIGEAQGAVTLLKVAGPFQYIVDSTMMDTSLIIVAPQLNTKYPNTQIIQQLISAVKQKWNVVHIAVSGYSEGCQDWTNYLWDSAAAFASVNAWFMASADPTTLPQYGGPAQHPQWFGSYRVYYNGVCGTADGFYSPQLQLFDSAQLYTTGSFVAANFNSLTGVGHSSASWGPYFSPYYKDPSTGMSEYNTFMKKFPVTAAPTPTPAPAPAVKTIVRSCLTTYYATKTQTMTVVYSDSSYTITTIQ